MGCRTTRPKDNSDKTTRPNKIPDQDNSAQLIRQLGPIHKTTRPGITTYRNGPERTETDRNGLLLIPKRTFLVPKRTLVDTETDRDGPERTETDFPGYRNGLSGYRNGPERTETDFPGYRNGLSGYRNRLSGYRNGL